MLHLRKERSIPLWNAAKWKNPFWIFFPTSFNRGSAFMSKATLPTRDYTVGPGQMVWWVWQNVEFPVLGENLQRWSKTSCKLSYFNALQAGIT